MRVSCSFYRIVYMEQLCEFLKALDLQHRAQVMETTGYEDLEDYSNM